MPNKTATLLCCGILAALCWSLADMLLVGFVRILRTTHAC